MKKTKKLLYAGYTASFIATLFVGVGTRSVLAALGMLIGSMLVPLFFIGSKEEYDAEQKPD